ncbi:YLS9 protein [Spatholobus suberectus]|nr:YLS9 protein [Spatholobus suberectus]
MAKEELNQIYLFLLWWMRIIVFAGSLIVLFGCLICVTGVLILDFQDFSNKHELYDMTVVTDASITQFDYVDNTLHYDLALNVTVSNIVYGYDYIEAGASYQDAMLGFSILKPFNGSINELNAVFNGHHDGLSLGTKEISEMNKENLSGVFRIIVKLCLRHRYYTYHLNPMVRCDLHVPLKSHKEVHGFHATQCHLLSTRAICSIL